MANGGRQFAGVSRFRRHGNPFLKKDCADTIAARAVARLTLPDATLC